MSKEKQVFVSANAGRGEESLARSEHTGISEENVILKAESELNRARRSRIEVLDEDEETTLSDGVSTDRTAEIGIVNNINLVEQSRNTRCAGYTDRDGGVSGKHLVNGSTGLNPLSIIGVRSRNVRDRTNTDDRRDTRDTVNVNCNAGRKNGETLEEGGVLVETHRLMATDRNVRVKRAVNAITDVIESAGSARQNDAI